MSDAGSSATSPPETPERVSSPLMTPDRPGASKLDSLSREDLLKLLKRHMLRGKEMQQKLEATEAKVQLDGQTLNQKLRESERKFTALEEEATCLREKDASLAASLRALDEDRVSMSTKLKEGDAKVAALTDANEGLVRRLEKLQEQMTAEQEQRTDMLRQGEKTDQRLKDLLEESNAATARATELETNKDELESKLIVQLSRIGALEAQLEDVSKNASLAADLNVEKETIRSQMSNLELVVAEHLTTIAKLQTQVEELQHFEVSAKADELKLERLQAEFQELKQLSRNDHANLLAQFDTERAEYDSANSKLSACLAEEVTKLESATGKIVELQSQNAQLLTSLDEQKATMYSDIESKEAIYISRIGDLEAKLVDQCSEYEQKATMSSDLESKEAEYISRIADLEATLVNQCSEETTVEELRNENAQLTQSFSDEKAKLLAMASQMQDFLSQLDSLAHIKEERDQLTAESSSLTGTNLELRKSLSGLTSQVSELEQGMKDALATAACREAERRIAAENVDTLTDSLETLRTEYNSAVSRSRFLEAEQEQLNISLGVERMNFEQLRTEFETAKEELLALRELEVSLTNAKLERDEALAKLQSSLDENVELKARVEEQETANSEVATTEERALSDKVETLRNEVAYHIHENAIANKELERLKDVAETFVQLKVDHAGLMAQNNAELEAQCGQLELMKSERGELANKLDCELSTAKEAGRLVEELRLQVATLEGESNRLQQAAALTESQIISLNEQLKLKNQELEESMGNQLHMSEQIENAESRCRAAVDEARLCQDCVGTLQQELNDKKEQLADVSATMSDSLFKEREALDELRSQLDEVRNEVAGTREEAAAAELAARQRLEEAEYRVQELEVESANLSAVSLLKSLCDAVQSRDDVKGAIPAVQEIVFQTDSTAVVFNDWLSTISTTVLADVSVTEDSLTTTELPTTAQDSVSIDGIRVELQEKTELAAKLKTLAVKTKKELLAARQQVDSSKAELSEMTSSRDSIALQLERKMEQLAQQESMHQDELSTASQSGMLELELADALKQLKERKAAEDKLSSVVSTQLEQISQLQSALSKSSTGAAAAADTANNLQRSLDNTLVQLEDATVRWQRLDSDLSSLRTETEEIRGQLERAKLELSSSSRDAASESERRRMTLVQLESNLESATQQHSELERRCEKVERERDAMAVEFQQYRVRAQGVLAAQRAAPAPTVGPNEPDEVLLRRQQELERELASCQQQLSLATTKYNKLADWQKATEARLSGDVAECRAEVGRLSLQLDAARTDADALAVQWKTRLDRSQAAFEDSLAAEAASHSRQLEQLEAEVRRLRAADADRVQQSPAMMDNYSPPPVAERLEAEGDETPSDPAAKETLAMLLTGQVPLEKRVTHLTELLADAEAEVSRLSEQTRVLKGEIRRIEGNEERSVTLSNLEYLKNVVLQFLSLPDTRPQLVPVLQKLLQLSHSETSILHDAATPVQPQPAAGWLGRFGGMI